MAPQRATEREGTSIMKQNLRLVMMRRGHKMVAIWG